MHFPFRLGCLEMGLQPFCVSVPCMAPRAWLVCSKWLQNHLWLVSVIRHLCAPMALVPSQMDEEDGNCVSFLSSLA